MQQPLKHRRPDRKANWNACNGLKQRRPGGASLHHSQVQHTCLERFKVSRLQCAVQLERSAFGRDAPRIQVEWLKGRHRTAAWRDSDPPARPSRDGGSKQAKAVPRDDPKGCQVTARVSTFSLAESPTGWLQKRFQGAESGFYPQKGAKGECSNLATRAVVACATEIVVFFDRRLAARARLSHKLAVQDALIATGLVVEIPFAVPATQSNGLRQHLHNGLMQ